MNVLILFIGILDHNIEIQFVILIVIGVNAENVYQLFNTAQLLSIKLLNKINC